MTIHKQTLSFVLLICFTLPAAAQWRVGAYMGAAHNHYSADVHYMTDVQYGDRWAFGTVGITGQYDIRDWLGVRADVNWMRKSYTTKRSLMDTYYRTHNDYVQLPLMVTFNFGAPRVRGFLNLGVYGGYWFGSKSTGKYTIAPGYEMEDSWKNDFHSERDARLDFGLTGGLGVEWRFHLLGEEWAWQVLEARCYYSLTSTTKDYMRMKDPHYNTTLTLQSGITYFFK